MSKYKGDRRKHTGLTELSTWSHWLNDPPKIKFMNKIAKGFQKQYNIKVNIKWITKNELKKKVMFALDREKIDLIYMDNSFRHPRLSNSLLDLSDLKFSGQIVPNWYLGYLGNRKNIFLPIEGVAYGIYYNRALFDKAGILITYLRRNHETNYNFNTEFSVNFLQPV